MHSLSLGSDATRLKVAPSFSFDECLCYLPLQREEITREPTLLKKLCSAIREGVTVDNCCDLYAAVHSLWGDGVEEEGGQKREEVTQSTSSVSEAGCLFHSPTSRRD